MIADEVMQAFNELTRKAWPTNGDEVIVNGDEWDGQMVLLDADVRQWVTGVLYAVVAAMMPQPSSGRSTKTPEPTLADVLERLRALRRDLADDDELYPDNMARLDAIIADLAAINGQQVMASIPPSAGARRNQR